MDRPTRELASWIAMLAILATLAPGCPALLRECGTAGTGSCDADELCDQPDPSQPGTCVTRCPADRLGGLCDDGRVCVSFAAGSGCAGGGSARPGEACGDALHVCVIGAVCAADGTCVELCDSRHACSQGRCELSPVADRGQCVGL